MFYGLLCKSYELLFSVNNTDLTRIFFWCSIIGRPARSRRERNSLFTSMSPKMSNSVDMLENRVGNLEVNMEMVQFFQENVHTSFKTLKQTFLQQMTKLVNRKGDPEKESGTSCIKLEQPGDNLEEFKLAARKVELVMFDAQEPVDWITSV